MNSKGVTLVELMAVIIVASIILFPMLGGFIANLDVNERMHNRRAASSLGDTTIEAFSKVHFDNLYNHLNGEPLAEIDADDCALFTIDVDDPFRLMGSDEVCGMIFDQMWSNITFEEDAFRVFIASNQIDENDWETIEAMDVPDKVLAAIEALDETERADENFLNMFVWMEYDADYNLSLLVEGDVSRD